MHPIEQLRFVARAGGADAALLVQEAASALGFFAHDHPGMVTAARRLLTRQPAVGPLWSLGARMATAMDARAEARAVIAEHRDDPTPAILAAALGDEATVVIAGWPDLLVQALTRRGDVSVLVIDVEGQARSVVSRLARAGVDAEAIDAIHTAGAVAVADVVAVEACAMGTGAALVEVGNLAAVAVARLSRTPVWLVAGVGRRLPEPYWQAIVERIGDDEMPVWLAANEVLSLGLADRVVTPQGVTLVEELQPCPCPLAPELLRPVK